MQNFLKAFFLFISLGMLFRIGKNRHNFQGLGSFQLCFQSSSSRFSISKRQIYFECKSFKNVGDESNEKFFTLYIFQLINNIAFAG